MKKKQLKPYQSIVFFVLVMAAFITLCVPAQRALGMGGLMITELMFLGCSLLCVWVCKVDFKEVFPIKKLQAAPICGSLLLWIGAYLGTMVVSIFLMWMMPGQFMGVSQSLNDTMSSVPLILSVLIAAVMPAICEESVFRGVILNGLSHGKYKWAAILTTGILFGIMHLNFIRFFPIVILGVAMAYIMYETKNMLYPMMLHLGNNMLSLFSGNSVADSTLQSSIGLLEQSGMMQLSFGIYMTFAAVVPFLVYTAAYLLRRTNTDKGTVTYLPTKGRWVMLSILIALTAVLFLGGILICVLAFVWHPDMINGIISTTDRII